MSSAPLSSFSTYEEYLDSAILPEDAKFLASDDLMRALVELGYRGSGETLKRDEFEARKAESTNAHFLGQSNAPKLLTHTHAGRSLTPYPLLAALAEREEALRTGKLSSILFLRERNAKGQEVSGYIDIADRMKTEDFVSYFVGKKKLTVKMSDLSYYNWDTGVATSNNSANFQVKVDEGDKDDGDDIAKPNVNAMFLSAGGLLFKNKRDRKLLSVDPYVAADEQTRRTQIDDEGFIQCIIYDHVTRRKS